MRFCFAARVNSSARKRHTMSELPLRMGARLALLFAFIKSKIAPHLRLDVKPTKCVEMKCGSSSNNTCTKANSLDNPRFDQLMRRQ
jgi:hypothetical protein